MFIETVVFIVIVLWTVWELKHLIYGWSATNFLTQNHVIFDSIARKRKEEIVWIEGMLKTGKVPELAEFIEHTKNAQLTEEEYKCFSLLKAMTTSHYIHTVFEFILVLSIALMTNFWYAWVLMFSYSAYLFFNLCYSYYLRMNPPTFKELAEKKSKSFALWFDRVYITYTLTIFMMVIGQFYFGVWKF